MRLGEYLAVPRPAWDWVTHDCCRWIDRWCVVRGRQSPMTLLGVQYDSEQSALRRIMQGGGLVALWTAGMALAGVPEVDIVEPGDVAVINRPTACGIDEAMALYAGDRWATLGLHGLDFAPADALRVWRP